MACADGGSEADSGGCRRRGRQMQRRGCWRRRGQRYGRRRPNWRTWSDSRRAARWLQSGSGVGRADETPKGVSTHGTWAYAYSPVLITENPESTSDVWKSPRWSVLQHSFFCEKDADLGTDQSSWTARARRCKPHHCLRWTPIWMRRAVHSRYRSRTPVKEAKLSDYLR